MSKIDYEGDRALAKKLLAEGDAEKIALALRKHWHDGYERGKASCPQSLR